MIYDAAIIGAGAGGLFAAVNSNSKNIILFDKKIGAQKLAATGNNRSNITNCMDKERFIEQYGKNGNFLRDTFKLFFRDDLIVFLQSIGFKTICKDNRVVLKNRTSLELAETLLKSVKNKASAFYMDEPAIDIIKHKGLFKIITNKGQYKSKFILMACGGMSCQKTGSDGSCYKIAKKLGHTVIEPEPFEVPFCAKNIRNLQGLSFNNAGLALKIGKKKFKEDGDIIFTHFGISGPAVLKLSEKDFNEGELYINFLNIDKDSLKNRICSYKGKTRNLLKKYVPKRFADEYLNIDKYTHELNKRDVKLLLDTLLEFKINVKKCSFDRAFVTKGGVSTREINPKTMESKIVDNLFFCGEMIDIQGSIGGFNLQAAFSTAFSAICSINSNITHYER